jgi:purine-binding chemotaxis protein CheW
MTDSGHKYLIFTMQGRRYAFDLAQVAEVGEPPLTWPIPKAPSCYAGAMNFHGSIVAVMDLAAFLGIPGVHKMEKVIVLAPDIASLALQVEHVERTVPEGQVQISDQVPEGEEWFSSRTLLLADGSVVLIDAAELVREAAERIVV